MKTNTPPLHKISLILLLSLFYTITNSFGQVGCLLPNPDYYLAGYEELNQGSFAYEYSFENSYEGGCGYLNNRAKKRLIIKLDLGEDYDFGKSNWNLSFNLGLGIVGVDNFGTFLQQDIQFNINQNQPEQIAVINLHHAHWIINALLYLGSDMVEFTVSDLDASDLIKDNIRIQVYHEIDENIDVSGVSIDLSPLPVNANQVTSNPVNFNWTPSCTCTPNYEFQLLRLFNIDETNSENEETIRAKVDWNKALTLETQNDDPSLILSLVEGTGYYLWRVRPIGTQYPNGSGDNRNWGTWSDNTIWNSIENGTQEIEIPNLEWTTDKPYAFFYRQFDEDKNWIYARSFSEANKDGKIKIAEEITYANGLLQVEQHQRHLFSQGNILASRTILDQTGRPALSTIYAPVEGQNHVGYITGFANNNDGEKYNSQDFDLDGNYTDPEPINNGILNEYYSDNNPDEFIPSAEGYAYSRNLFYGDGMDRIKEASGIGHLLRINSDASEPSHTSRFYYSGVSETELVRIFGDEAPNSSKVIKMIAVDPNQTTTVTYQDREGRTLATCLSSNSNDVHHDPLPSRGGFSVQDEITGNTSCGGGCLLSSKTVSFVEPTPVRLIYDLEINTITEICTNQCTTCDYYIKFSIKRIDDPYDANFPIDIDPLILPPTLCQNLEDFTVFDQTYQLPPGTFLIERRIEVYNTNPNSIDTQNNPFGDTYLEEQLVELESTLLEEIENNSLWQTINNYLLNTQTEELYEYLTLNHGLTEDAEEFSFTAGCCEFTIPVYRCKDCLIENQDFEDYYNSIYPSTPIEQYIPNFESGQLNTMIQNMVAEDEPYLMEDLCRCWTSIVQGWGGLVNQNFENNVDYEPNLLETFLNCTGRRYFLTDDTPPTPSLEIAYQWTYVKGSSPSCEQTVCLTLNNDESPFYQADVTCNTDREIDWDNTNLTNEQWDVFYHCTTSDGDPIPPAIATQIANQTLDELLIACNDACENRLQSFVTALTNYYENEIGATVSGDCNTSLVFPITSGACVPLYIIYCQANQLVELCKQSCVPLTPIYEGQNVVGFGTLEEVEGYQQAMYYGFELVQGGLNGRCPMGFTQTTVSLSSATIQDEEFAELLLDYLNDQWGTFINNSIEGALFNLTETLNDFFPGLGRRCSRGRQDLFLPATAGSYFTVLGCELYLINNRKKRIRVCKNICRKINSSCGAVCLRWIPIVIPPDNIDHVFEYITCEEQTTDHSLTILSGQLQNCIDAKIEAFEQQYIDNCINPNNIEDKFTLEYYLGYYHYTLYYYDRAGNLIQTVAPNGVKEEYTSRLSRTDHDFRTQYRFNSLKQLIWQWTPDGGATKMYYDDFGQLRFSQNAQQELDGTYAYTKYDHLGRVVETGKATNISLDIEDINNPQYPNTGLSEQIYTVYNTPIANPLTNAKTQRFLQNRVSYTYTAEDIYTIYSYDPHGNVEWVIQDILPELEMNDPTAKQFLIEYEYDLISNKVTRINYQPDKIDQFFTEYNYDEDNRITEVRTSNDGRIWDKDAKYKYYQHGPLRRHEIGEDKVQGMDYVYTIQGWLKSINHPLMVKEFDPGQDSYENSRFGEDAFSSGLTYHEGDFIRSGTKFSGFYYDLNFPLERNLYNGNISLWLSNSKHQFISGQAPDLRYSALSARRFKYDELNRITNSDFLYHSVTWKNTDEYDSNYSYDANGNILTLNRNAYRLENGESKMDKVSYYYNQGVSIKNNRLQRISDVAYPFVGGSQYENDLEFQRRYTYDAIGNTIKDDPSANNESDLTMVWNLQNKVKQVSKSDEMVLNYKYDASGNRILKKVTASNGSEKYTWFVRDGDGNILSIYTLEGNPDNAWEITQEELPLYGSKRIGSKMPNQLAFGKNVSQQDIIPQLNLGKVFTRILDKKVYELTDHLNNVRKTVSDIKKSTNNINTPPKNFKADILSGMEYFPFGSLMPKRSYEGEGLRFGFQGQEMDNEEKGVGDDIYFSFREFDSRLGRFISRDPLIRKYPYFSPYSFSGNRLIDAVELEGLEPELIPKYEREKTEKTIILPIDDRIIYSKIENTKGDVWNIEFKSSVDLRFNYNSVELPATGHNRKNDIELEKIAKIGDAYEKNPDIISEIEVTGFTIGHEPSLSDTDKNQIRNSIVKEFKTRVEDINFSILRYYRAKVIQDKLIDEGIPKEIIKIKSNETPELNNKKAIDIKIKLKEKE